MDPRLLPCIAAGLVLSLSLPSRLSSPLPHVSLIPIMTNLSANSHFFGPPPKSRCPVHAHHVEPLCSHPTLAFSHSALACPSVPLCQDLPFFLPPSCCRFPVVMCLSTHTPIPIRLSLPLSSGGFAFVSFMLVLFFRFTHSFSFSCHSSLSLPLSLSYSLSLPRHHEEAHLLSEDVG